MTRRRATWTVAMKWAIFFFSLIFSSFIFAKKNIVNIYLWSEEIPPNIILNFEKETGIQVNLSTFDSNEIMYTKLRAGKNPGYDIVEPSSYYIDRMRHKHMLLPLDRSKLFYFKNLDPWFFKQNYDPGNQFSLPFVWGITGIFTNEKYFCSKKIKDWTDLFDPRYHNQLMILDDPREAFSMALLMLGYSINDTHPQHIRQAWLKLRKLMPNIRLFNNDAIKSILIDEDATLGMVWNSDLASARLENKDLQFIIPHKKFEIWIDNFAILATAPHVQNAYRFLNYILRPDIAAAISLKIGYATTNLAAKRLLPFSIQNNHFLYPPPTILEQGEFETDVGDVTFALYEKYWEKLKMNA